MRSICGRFCRITAWIINDFSLLMRIVLHMMSPLRPMVIVGLALGCLSAYGSDQPQDLERLITNGNNAAIERLLDEHPDLLDAAVQPHYRMHIPSLTDGYHPLHYAVERKNEGLADWLIKHGADVNARA